MDMDIAPPQDKHIATEENANEAKIEKWERSNPMSVMIMNRSIPEVFRDSITEDSNVKMFLEDVQQLFFKNEKAKTNNLLSKVVSMRYKGKGNIREYIMEMSNLASKLKSLKLKLFEDLLVYLILISLPAHIGQFKVSYNTLKDT